MRNELKKPLGEIIHKDINYIKTAQKASVLVAQSPYVICVGDIVYESLCQTGFLPDIGIIDNKTQRKQIEPPHASQHKILNKAGTVRKSAVQRIDKMIKRMNKDRNTQIMTVWGEEDLLALPCILLAPLGTSVVYGQTEKGIVHVRVTEEVKKLVTDILKRFTQE
jgi:uncharacterized protein (UPF0218 family)